MGWRELDIRRPTRDRNSSSLKIQSWDHGWMMAAGFEHISGIPPGVPQLSWLIGWAERRSLAWSDLSLSAARLHAEYRRPGDPGSRCLVSGISMGQREGRLSVWRWKRGDEKPCFQHLQWVVSVQMLMRPREAAARSAYPACLPHLMVQQYQQLPVLSLLNYYVCVPIFMCLF